MMVRNGDESLSNWMQEMNMAACLTHWSEAKTGKDFNYFKS